MTTLSRSLITVCAITVLGFGLACGGGSDDDIDWGDDLGSSSGSADIGEVKSSCNTIDSLSQCSNNGDDAYVLGEGFLKEVCGMLEGDFKAGSSCPTEGLVGTCGDGAGTITNYYSSGDLAYTADTAKTSCEFTDGAWKAAS